jgi:hypothetical protein
MLPRPVRPTTWAEHLTLGAAAGIAAASAVWLVALVLSHLDAGWAAWAPATAAALIEEMSLGRFVDDALTGGAVAGTLFALGFWLRGAP